MTNKESIPDVQPDLQDVPKDRFWVLVPILSFGSIVVGWSLGVLLIGTAGCVLTSFLLAYLAYRKPKKDIVSLLTPVYAVLIFFNQSFDQTILLPIQILYSASLMILVLRLNARFSRKDEVKKRFTDIEEEETFDESLSE